MYNLEYYEDKSGKFRWRLTHSNGNVVGASSQGFSSKASAKNNVASTLRGLSEITENPNESSYTLEMYTDKKGEHRWQLIARNGEIVCSATEGFSSKSSAKGNIESHIKGLTSIE